MLISALAPGMLKAAEIGAAFTVLLSELDDLALDVPTAPSLLPIFLARFVLDETLPAAFLESLEGEVSNTRGVKALAAARALLRSSKGTAEVLHAWGGGGAGSVAHSKKAFAAVLDDYIERFLKVSRQQQRQQQQQPALSASAVQFLSSRACVADWLERAYAEVLQEQPPDPMAALAERCRVKAATLKPPPPTTVASPASPASAAGADPRMLACRQLRELCVPHFLWEFVRQAVLRALLSREQEDAIARLLARASASGLVLSDQFELGLSMVRGAAAASEPQPAGATGSAVSAGAGALEGADGVIERLGLCLRA